MKKAVILILILALFLVSCKTFSGEEYVPGDVDTPPAEAPVDEPEPIDETFICTHNANCTTGKLCIESQCQFLENFFQVDDTCKTCKVSKVELVTSDGEVYNLPPGQGGYTAVSALEWTILRGSEYCQGNTPTIPIEILKRNYGDIVSNDVILLKEGETSDVMRHPLIKRIAFTLRIKSIEETCS